MKKILILSATLILSLSSSLALAQERATNPGEDPNEARSAKAQEADVGAPGICPECIARMKHGRIQDDTTYRKNGSTPSPDSNATRKGTQ